jgi:hypothetical protein
MGVAYENMRGRWVEGHLRGSTGLLGGVCAWNSDMEAVPVDGDTQPGNFKLGR